MISGAGMNRASCSETKSNPSKKCVSIYFTSIADTHVALVQKVIQEGLSVRQPCFGDYAPEL